MGLFDKLFGKKKPVKDETKPTEKPQKKISAKEQATLNNEPYVNIVRMEIDPNDINSGAFELDWNDKFLLNLIKSGFKMKEDDTDQVIVDRWFQQVCRNVALEMYEQQQADPENRYRAEMRVVQTRDLGNGRSEVS